MKSIDCPSCNGTCHADGIERDLAAFNADPDVQPCPDCGATGTMPCALCDHSAVKNVDGTYLCMAHLPPRMKLRIVA
jgi:hypothetical protein